jgi:YD repeat-containing protein
MQWAILILGSRLITGRLTGATTQYTFLTGRNFTTNYSYDAASNRTGFTHPEGGTTSYARATP